MMNTSSSQETQQHNTDSDTIFSCFLPSDSNISPKERKLLEAATVGNLEVVKDIIHHHLFYCEYVNLNCTDSLDRTALSLSTIHGHKEIVEFLLSDEIDSLNLGDSLFYAIQAEAYDIIEMLLEKDPQTSLRVLPGTTSPFEPGLTPFKFAAHKNNYRILSVLYKYSHRLSFSDNELIVDEKFDTFSWDAVTDRLLHYRARSSPAFMLLMYNEKGLSWDPLNASMDLYVELKTLALREREVEETYIEMAERCEDFAVDLLSEVRSSSELADLMHYSLSEEQTANDIQITHSLDEFTYNPSLLKPIEKAVQYGMKNFVTSDNSQLALIYIQKGKLFREMKGYKALFTQIFLGCIYPILTIAFMVAPNSSFGKLLLNPTVKFWCWIMSEIYFVALLIANTIHVENSDSNTSLSHALLVGYFWIVGKFIQEISELSNENIKEYFLDPWNINDMVTIILYTLYIIFRALHPHKDSKFRYGSGWDFLQMSDACIAVAYVLVHFRILEVLRVERTFGPLQISLERMAKDALSFSVILLIIFLAFGSGICELFTPYGSRHYCTCNDYGTCNESLKLVPPYTNEDKNLSSNSTLPACVSCRADVPDQNQVSSLIPTLLGIWWTTFGYGDPRAWYSISHCPDKFILQEMTGFFIIALFHFTVIIVLFNMLIAMMSNSFQQTQDDSVREWKYYRTQLWLKLVSNKINLVPPMNILPSVKFILKCARAASITIYKWWNTIYKCCSKRHDQNPDHIERGNVQMSRRCDNVPQLTSQETSYQKVMRLVVLRYVKKKVLNDEMVI